MQKRIFLDNDSHHAEHSTRVSVYHVLIAGAFLSMLAALGFMQIIYYSNTF